MLVVAILLCLNGDDDGSGFGSALLDADARKYLTLEQGHLAGFNNNDNINKQRIHVKP